jgi:hypothetical protein
MKSASALIIIVTITISSALLCGRPIIAGAGNQSLESVDAKTSEVSIE